MLANGAKATIENNLRETAFDKALQQDRVEAVARNNREQALSSVQTIEKPFKLGTFAIQIKVERKRKYDFFTLLCKGVDCNEALSSKGETWLHKAVLHNDAGLCSLLISLKADCNAKTKDGETPLMYACKAGYRDICLVLLKNTKVEVGLKDMIQGSTTLFFACDAQHIDIIQLLLTKKEWDPTNSRNGFDVNELDGLGRSLLHRAAVYNNSALVEFILSLQKNPNIQDKDGNTALHLATGAKLHKIVEKLLVTKFSEDRKIDPTVKNGSNRAALYYAVDNKDLETTTILLNYGSKIEDEYLFLAVDARVVELFKLLKERMPIKNFQRITQGLSNRVRGYAELENLIGMYLVVPENPQPAGQNPTASLVFQPIVPNVDDDNTGSISSGNSAAINDSLMLTNTDDEFATQDNSFSGDTAHDLDQVSGQGTQ